MPYTRTSQSRNPGTQSSSRSPRSKNVRTPKISKYFSKIEDDAESPYKNVVSEVQSIAFDDAADDDDFNSPVPKKMVQLKPPKAVPKVTKRNLPRKSTRRKNPMQKTLEDNFKGTGVNGEHLQMALALSESTYMENLNKSSGDAEEKTKLFKQALEKFGLRCGGKPDKNPFEAPKLRNTKKSRYRFVTPILKLRTDEERQSLLASKVSLLLTRNARFEQNYLATTAAAPVQRVLLHSDSLKENLCEGFENFNLHSLSVEELTEERFYVSKLNLTRSEGATCGCLLKNWRRIPGRDLSPLHQTDENEIEETPSREVDRSEARNWTSEDSLEQIDASMGGGGMFESEDGASEAAKQTEESFSESHGLSDARSDQAGCSLGRAEATEEISRKAFRESTSKECSEEVNNKVEGYRTDSEDLETFAFSNLTDLLRPSPEEIQVAKEERSVSPDLFDDSSQSLLSPIKISPTSKNNTQTKKVEHSKSSNIVEVDLTQSSEDEEANCMEIELTSNCRRAEVSKVQHGKVCMEYRFEMHDAEDLNKERKYQEIGNVEKEEETKRNDVIEETPTFDFDATIILSEAERNAHVLTTRRSESEDCIETPDLDFDDCDKESAVDISRIERPSAEKVVVSKNEVNANLEQTEDLDVTEYVMHILNNRNSSILKGSPGNSTVRTELFPESTSSSQDSITISDDELNYSSALSKSLLKRKVSYELSSSDSEIDEENGKSRSVSPAFSRNSSVQSPAKVDSPEPVGCPAGSSEPHATADLLNDSLNGILESSVFDKFTTPSCKVSIKTDDVTPMPDYDEMDTPKVAEALEKFGVKPLKRKKGATFLKYIYESTHPLVESKHCSSDEGDEAVKVVKKRRTDDDLQCRNLEEMIDLVRRSEGEVRMSEGSESEELQAEIEEMQARHAEPIEILGEKLTADEELVFERSQSKRLPSCRVPLQIVWHNFVSANPNVRENILLYEPLQLEVLHVMLKQQGYKFNIQDLLAFLDKKCITIRTNQTGSSGRRKPKKS